jgi:hypothetical protein
MRKPKKTLNSTTIITTTIIIIIIIIISYSYILTAEYYQQIIYQKNFAEFVDYSLILTEDFCTNNILLILIVSYPPQRRYFS